MTETLAGKTCSPCRGGIPPLTREQAALFRGQSTDWQLFEEAHRIERGFRFRNFREALTFVQEIGELAEAERHHPNISFGWGNATSSTCPATCTTFLVPSAFFDVQQTEAAMR
jgi:4a-hydroxytetrahydrobiopterin dehydratase